MILCKCERIQPLFISPSFSCIAVMWAKLSDWVHYQPGTHLTWIVSQSEGSLLAGWKRRKVSPQPGRVRVCSWSSSRGWNEEEEEEGQIRSRGLLGCFRTLQEGSWGLLRWCQSLKCTQSYLEAKSVFRRVQHRNTADTENLLNTKKYSRKLGNIRGAAFSVKTAAETLSWRTAHICSIIWTWLVQGGARRALDFIPPWSLVEFTFSPFAHVRFLQSFDFLTQTRNMKR